MTEARYIGTDSLILKDNWTDYVPSYHSYYDAYKKRMAAKSKARQERIVFFVTAVLLVVMCMSFFSVNGSSRETYADCYVHVIKSGETLWSIAREYKGERMSTDEFVYEIKKANDMKTSEIIAGEELVIPVIFE